MREPCVHPSYNKNYHRDKKDKENFGIPTRNALPRRHYWRIADVIHKGKSRNTLSLSPAASKTAPISRVYEGRIKPISSGMLSFRANLNAAPRALPDLMFITRLCVALFRNQFLRYLS